MPVRVLESGELTLSDIEDITWVRSVSSILNPISVSFDESQIPENNTAKNLCSRYFSHVEATEESELMRTLNFLFFKFEPLFPILIAKFWIEKEYFMEQITKRLASQIQEARQNWRKYTNGTVGSLKKIRENGDFVLEKIPYWAFWSTNVSLDAISYDTDAWARTLREIMEEIGERNETWEFYLPNSLWVSVMIQLADGTIIAQQRNNNATLTQRTGLVSSASGALSLLDHKESWGIELLQANAVAEVYEELWLKTNTRDHFPIMEESLTRNIQYTILRELWIDKAVSGELIPCWVSIERIRHNPEVVFTLVLNPDIDLAYIKEKWGKADDKWESIWLIWITSAEIEKQVQFFLKNIPSQFQWTPGWLDRYIQTLDQSISWAWPHLLMSYLAWRKAIEDSHKKYQTSLEEILGNP